MFLPAYSTPSPKVAATAVKKDQPLPANESRVWLMLYNPTDEPVGVMLVPDVVSLVLAPQETRVLPSPVYIGPVCVYSGTAIATELLRNA